MLPKCGGRYGGQPAPCRGGRTQRSAGVGGTRSVATSGLPPLFNKYSLVDDCGCPVLLVVNVGKAVGYLYLAASHIGIAYAK